MKYLAATTIPVEIAANGRSYLPLTQKLRGKNILAINAVSVTPFSGSALAITDSLTISLTSDGVDYILRDMPLTRLTLDTCRGLNTIINRSLSIQDCYIQNAAATSGVVTLVVWYQMDGLSVATPNTRHLYDAFDTLVSVPGGMRNYLPDNRTLVGRSIKQLYSTFPTTTANGHTGVLKSEMIQSAYISLYRGSYAIWDRIPVAVLDQVGWYAYLQIQDMVFDFESSFVEVAASTVTSGYLQLNVKYE